MKRGALLVFVLAMIAGGACGAGPSPRRSVNLNTAGLEELMTLPGVGRKRAQQIVAFRTKRVFRRTSELLRIRGIGRKLYRRLLPLIRVEAPAK